YQESDRPTSAPEETTGQPGSSWPHRSFRDQGDAASPHELHRRLRERPAPTARRASAPATFARALAALLNDQSPRAAPIGLAVLASNRSAASTTMDGVTSLRQTSRGMLGQSGKSPTRMHGLPGRVTRMISCRVPQGPN